MVECDWMTEDWVDEVDGGGGRVNSLGMGKWVATPWSVVPRLLVVMVSVGGMTFAVTVSPA